MGVGRLAVILFGLFLFACEGSAGGGPDGGMTQDAVSQELATVMHEREFRGVWVATVINMNFPSARGLSAAEQKAELLEILDVSRDAGFNAVVFQVRPEGDALYESELEPWSRYLTGSPGEDPGYDPLQFVIDEGHARGLEIHAWFNPYRARYNNDEPLAGGHLCARRPAACMSYRSWTWMDPGREDVQDLTHDVILDVATRYDVDGVHFDDYFYPYPDETPFPDDASYDAYQSSGGTLGRADWRRDNVNRLIARLSASLRAEAPWVRFGISPFGIYRPGEPPGITGLDQYAALYADPVKWVGEEWLDYNAPQLYWPTNQTAQAFETLLNWWTSLPPDGQQTFAGHFLNKLGSDPDWDVAEFELQHALTREYRDQGSLGGIWFHIDTLRVNRDGIFDVFQNQIYPEPVATPAIPRARERSLAPPTVALEGSKATLAHDEVLRHWLLYRQDGDAWALDRILLPSEDRVDLMPGVWAISALDRFSVESQGVVLRIAE